MVVMSQGPTRQRELTRRWGLLLLVFAVVLGLLGIAGVMTHWGGFVWPRRLLDYPALLGTVAALCAGVGLVWTVDGHRKRRGTAAAVSVVFALCWWFAMFVVGIFGGVEQVARVEAEERTAVVMRGFNLIDPYWDIYVEDTNPGLLSKWAYVGCVNGDWQSFERVVWAGDRLVVHSSHGAVAVTFGEDGKPDDVQRTPRPSHDEGSTGPILSRC